METSLFLKISTAGLYAFASLMITFSNKIVLTSYKFGCFRALALGQILVSLVFLQLARLFGWLNVSPLNKDTFLKFAPLAFFYFGNAVFGLGAIKSISLPMFSCLRKVTLLITMYGEMYLLKKDKPFEIKVLIYVILSGSFIAAYYDLGFELYGYIYVMINNIFTASNSLYTKYTLDNKVNEYEILYFSALFTILPMFCVTYFSPEKQMLSDFDKWQDAGFMTFFIFSCTIGFFLNYSIVICTKYNSPLTTAIIGTLKNIIVIYFGMFIGGDYIFSWSNLIGLLITSVGSLCYTYLTLFKKTDDQYKPVRLVNEENQK